MWPGIYLLHVCWFTSKFGQDLQCCLVSNERFFVAFTMMEIYFKIIAGSIYRLTKRNGLILFISVEVTYTVTTYNCTPTVCSPPLGYMPYEGPIRPYTPLHFKMIAESQESNISH